MSDQIYMDEMHKEEIVFNSAKEIEKQKTDEQYDNKRLVKDGSAIQNEPIVEDRNKINFSGNMEVVKYKKEDVDTLRDYKNESEEHKLNRLTSFRISKSDEDIKYIDKIQNLSFKERQKYDDKTLSRLNVVKGRNLSHILFNQRKLGGDSEEMEAVKNSVAKVEAILSSLEKYTDEEFESIDGAYQVAIADCRHYIATKNPTFEYGVRRRQMVKDTLDRLFTEKGQLRLAKKLLSEGKINRESIENPYDLMAQTEAYQYQNEDPIGDMNVKKAVGVHALTIEDYAKTISSKNRGEIYFKNGAFVKVNNSSYAQSGFGETMNMVFGSDIKETVENRQMLERLYKMLNNERLKNYKDAVDYMQKAAVDLKIDAGQSKVGVIERKKFGNIIGTGCVYGSKVDYFTVGKSERIDSDIIIAKNIRKMFGSKEEKKKNDFDYNSGELCNLDMKDNEQRATINELRNQYVGMIKRGRKLGVNIPSASSDILTGFTMGTIAIVRDKTFDIISDINKGLCVFNHKLGTENAKRITEDKKIMDKAAAMAFARFMAKGPDSRAQVDVMINDFIRDTVFKMTESEEGSDKMLQKDCDTMINPYLSNLGSAGLTNLINKKLIDNKKWKNNVEDVREGTRCLRDLCDNLNRLTLLQDIAVTEGLSENEAEEMLRLGESIERTLDEDTVKIDYVVKGIKDTRYEKGYKKLKKLKTKGFSFVNTISRLATRTLNKNKAEKIEKTGPEETELAERLEKLSGPHKTIVSVLLLEKSPDTLIKEKEDDNAKSIVELRRVLRMFPIGKVYKINVKIAGIDARLIQRADNTLNVEVDGIVVPLTRSAYQIANVIEDDMMSHADYYGETHAKEIADDILSAGDGEGVMLRQRDLCIKYLAGKTGQPDTFFANVSSAEIKQYALAVLNKGMEIDNLIRIVNEKESHEYINGSEIKELLGKLDEKRTTVTISKVKSEEKIEKEQEEAVKEREWTQDQKKLIKLFSEIVFTEESWMLDKENEENKPGSRMRYVFTQNMDALAMIIEKPEIIGTMLDEIPFLDGQEIEVEQKEKQEIDGQEQEVTKKVNKDLKTYVKESLNKFVKSPKIQDLKGGGWFGTAATKGKIALALSHQESTDALIDLEMGIDKVVDDSTKTLQEEIKKAAEEVFKNDGEADPLSGNLDELNPEVDGISEEEKAIRVAAGSEKLKKVIENSIHGDAGQGLFIKTVLSKYFVNVNQKDKRAMIASAIKNAKVRPQILVDPPKTEFETDEQKKAYEKSVSDANAFVMGNYLGGILKGAGPLLQKMLQGMPNINMNKELEVALEDMKSNLAPIPEKMVKAELQNVVARSGGKITNINIKKPLGAASVGQTFLCDMTYYKDKVNKITETKSVVVKLLKPDVRNRMMREKSIMLACARETDKLSAQNNNEKLEEKGGMEGTYEGQLVRIEEELDLTIEARNAQRGAVYDRGFSTISAMKVDNIVEPTTNVLILEEAKGKTVDRYMKDVKKNQNKLLGKYYMVNDKNELIRDKDGNITYKDLNYSNIKDITKIRTELISMLEGVQKRQKYVAHLVDNWVKEGIYGEGFYHGDLHAGNIMVDEDGLTLIDFGNATQLDEEQKKYVTRMMIASATGSTNLFMDSFEKLMGDNNTKTFKRKKADLRNVFSKILSLGDEKDAGTRIGAALTKAQEMGIEIPASIFNFSQSQLRLQDTVESLNTTITNLQNDIKKLDSISSPAGNQANDLYMHMVTRSNKDSKLMVRELVNSLKKGDNEEKEKEDLNVGIKNKNIDLFAKSALSKGTIGIELYSSFVDGLIKRAIDEPNPETAKIALSIVSNVADSLWISVEEGVRDNAKTELVELFKDKGEDYKESKEYQDLLAKKMDIFYNFKKDFSNLYLQEDGSPRSLEEVSSNFAELQKRKKTLMIDLLGAKDYEPFLELQEEINKSKVDDDRVNQLSDKILSNLRKKHEAPIANEPMLKSFNESIANTEDQDVYEAVNTNIQSMCEDKEVIGDKLCNQLEESFKAYRKAQKEDTERVEDARIKFINIYVKALMLRVENAYNAYSKEYDDSKPQSFVDIMGPVINSNISTSIQKLGKLNTLMYHKKLSALNK